MNFLAKKDVEETDLEQQNFVLKFYDNFNFFKIGRIENEKTKRNEISFPIQEKLCYFFLVIFCLILLRKKI